MRMGAAAVAGLLVASLAHGVRADSLEDEPYCQDTDLPLDQWEHDWCPLVGDKSEACPSLPKACQGKPRAGRHAEDGHGRVRLSTEPDGSGKPIPGGSGQGASGEGASGSGASGAGASGSGASGSGASGSGASGPSKGGSGPSKGSAPPSPPPPPPSPPPSLELPAGMSTLAQVAFFVVLGLALAWLVWTIIKNRMPGKLKDLESEEKAPAAAATAEDPEARRIIERDVMALLERARQAAARGDYKQAIDDSYAAALRRLEGDGLIDMHSSLTNGDYVRAVKDRPQLARALDGIVDDVERVHFGSTAPSASLYESVLGRVMPLVQRAGLVILFIASAWLTGCGPTTVAAEQKGLETGLSGTTALVRAIREHGVDVGYRAEPLEDVDDKVGVLVVLPSAVGEELDWDPVYAWVKAGGTLVLAGVQPEHKLVPLSLAWSDATTPVLVPEWYYVSKLAGLEVAVPPGPALATGHGAITWRDVLSRDDDTTYAAAGRLDVGEVVAFADDRLFSNISVAVANNAEAVARMVEGHGRVELCTSLTGAGAESPLDSLSRAHLTPLVAQLLLLLLLFVLWRGTAFGTRRDPPQHRRRNFADHVRALGLQYARASASVHAVGIYARWTLERLRERLPKSRRGDYDALVTEVADKSGRSREYVEAILSRAQAASDVYGPASMRPASLRGVQYAPANMGAQDVELMQHLAQLYAEVSQRRERG
jgi:hypothetical protein